MAIIQLLRSKIRMDGGTQSRAELDMQLAADYAGAEEGGETLPPADVFYDGKEYWLGDGFHRMLAWETRGREKVPVIVHQGDLRAAILFSVGANGRHGKRRTNEDKRRAVTTMLTNDRVRLDEGGKPWSDRKVAERCGVDHKFVGKIRVEVSGDGPQIDERTVERNGTTYTMKTAGINTNRAAEKEPPVVELDRYVPNGPTGDTSDVYRCPCCDEIFASPPDHCTACLHSWGDHTEGCTGVDDDDDVNKTKPESKPIEPKEASTPSPRGVGLDWAHKAIAMLQKIPPKDGLRKEALELVVRWCKHNAKETP